MPISSISGYNSIQEYNDNYLKPIREGRPEDVKKPLEVERKEEENKTPFEKRTECETCKNRKYVDGSNEATCPLKRRLMCRRKPVRLRLCLTSRSMCPMRLQREARRATSLYRCLFQSDMKDVLSADAYMQRAA